MREEERSWHEALPSLDIKSISWLEVSYTHIQNSFGLHFLIQCFRVIKPLVLCKLAPGGTG